MSVVYSAVWIVLSLLLFACGSFPAEEEEAGVYGHANPPTTAPVALPIREPLPFGCTYIYVDEYPAYMTCYRYGLSLAGDPANTGDPEKK